MISAFNAGLVLIICMPKTFHATPEISHVGDFNTHIIIASFIPILNVFNTFDALEIIITSASDNVLMYIGSDGLGGHGPSGTII